QPPDLVNLPPGCSFRPRCKLAIEKCAYEAPPLIEVGKDHWSACWVADQLEEAVKSEEGYGERKGPGSGGMPRPARC
ncbi:MAG: oligopeptide/dipeptide ABC transporter ATP-binding protein, partial [Candidatus Methylomirabilales bacterium]